MMSMDAVDINILKVGRQMDALVAAEVMGLQFRDGSWWDEKDVRVALPRYSTDRHESSIVERRIIYLLGLKLDYFKFLEDSLELDNLPNEELFLAYAHATPGQKCLAALKATMQQ